ncbi:MAG: hypothetical protein SGPRY_009627, partial [Prymnesium sp.]
HTSAAFGLYVHVKRVVQADARVAKLCALLSGVIDTRTCNLETKHSLSSFEAAMRAAGVKDPSECLICDDS